MILRIFLILIFSCFPGQLLFAALQTLEEINADLQAKKKELEPFDQSKVKVDVESLGLDDVDKKTEKEFNKSNLPDPEGAITPESTNQPKSLVERVQDLASEVREKITKSTKGEEEVESDQTEAVTKDLKEPSDQYVNLQKKKALKKRLAIERQKKENAKKQEENLQKFHKLRQHYLLEIGEDGEKINSAEEILPRKKDLNPFINEESPAPPLLDRYRTSENLHIPIVMTWQDKVNLLFDTISVNDVLAFNEAYKEIENPNVKNSLGDTILIYSLLMRRYPIIAAIIARGADVNMQNKLGYTPLNIAIELLDFKSFQMLADNKADLNDLDAFGRSYLMQAARVGFLPAVDLLVTRGVDMNLMDKDGFTALAIAHQHKRAVIVQYLLKREAKTWTEKPHDPKSQSLIQELENRWK